MPPTPIELRERASLYREAARNAAKDEDRRYYAACALALAQLAEALEGNGRMVAFLENVKVKNFLATVDAEVRYVIEKLIEEQEAEAAPPERTSRDWNSRAERCRKLADLLRSDTAGARLAALAIEIEEQARRWRGLEAIAKEVDGHRRVITAEIDGVIGRCRSELFFAKQLLRNEYTYSVGALYEEATACREEAASCSGDEPRRKFASQAMELAMLGEAVSRANDLPDFKP